ncbi:MAG: dockerin type I repeat-containing protein, partial [Clostridia bacterium]|nr:dockerin type I repeat-containing protein [Clostridia bacterium]
MKKLLSVLLALCMIFSVFACLGTIVSSAAGSTPYISDEVTQLAPSAYAYHIMDGLQYSGIVLYESGDVFDAGDVMTVSYDYFYTGSDSSAYYTESYLTGKIGDKDVMATCDNDAETACRILPGIHHFEGDVTLTQNYVAPSIALRKDYDFGNELYFWNVKIFKNGEEIAPTIRENGAFLDYITFGGIPFDAFKVESSAAWNGYNTSSEASILSPAVNSNVTFEFDYYVVSGRALAQVANSNGAVDGTNEFYNAGAQGHYSKTLDVEAGKQHYIGFISTSSDAFEAYVWSIRYVDNNAGKITYATDCGGTSATVSKLTIWDVDDALGADAMRPGKADYGIYVNVNKSNLQAGKEFATVSLRDQIPYEAGKTYSVEVSIYGETLDQKGDTQLNFRVGNSDPWTDYVMNWLSTTHGEIAQNGWTRVNAGQFTPTDSNGHIRFYVWPNFSGYFDNIVVKEVATGEVIYTQTVESAIEVEVSNGAVGYAAPVPTADDTFDPNAEPEDPEDPENPEDPEDPEDPVIDGDFGVYFNAKSIESEFATFTFSEEIPCTVGATYTLEASIYAKDFRPTNPTFNFRVKDSNKEYAMGWLSTDGGLFTKGEWFRASCGNFTAESTAVQLKFYVFAGFEGYFDNIVLKDSNGKVVYEQAVTDPSLKVTTDNGATASLAAVPKTDPNYTPKTDSGDVAYKITGGAAYSNLILYTENGVAAGTQYEVSFDYYCTNENVYYVTSWPQGDILDNVTGVRDLKAGLHKFTGTLTMDGSKSPAGYFGPSVSMYNAFNAVNEVYIWNISVKKAGEEVFDEIRDSSASYEAVPLAEVPIYDAYKIDFTTCTGNDYPTFAPMVLYSFPTSGSPTARVTFDYYVATKNAEVMVTASSGAKGADGTNHYFREDGTDTFSGVGSFDGTFVGPLQNWGGANTNAITAAIQNNAHKHDGDEVAPPRAVVYIWNYHFYIDGEEVFSDSSDSTPGVTVTRVKSADIPIPVLAGDANRSGEVDVLDLVRVKKHIADADGALVTTNADVNGDTGIDGADVILIKKIILGTFYTQIKAGNMSSRFDAQADEMRESIVMSSDSKFKASALGAVYYVSENGSDSNNGTSPKTPWKTLEKVNSKKYSGTSVVLFERGSTFRGHLTLKSNVSYGAYGNGDKPKILGSAKDYANETWTRVAGKDIWYCATPETVDIGNIIYDNGDAMGNKLKSRYVDANYVYAGGVYPYDDLDFWYNQSEQRVYVYSANGV